MDGKRFKSKIKLSTPQIITLGFAGVIFVGGLLLWLPWATVEGEYTSFTDAMFTSTTSVCVTGLVTQVTATHWTLFGKIVILGLIQVGGLGIVSLVSLVFITVRKKINLKSRRIIQETYNQDHLSGMVVMVKRIAKGVFIAEGLGAVLYAFTFVPRYGVARGIWYSVFHSVSAFCNAGIDILGPDSLSSYVENVPVNLITMLLIITGGIGFIVWWDLGKNIRKVYRREITLRNLWKNLQLHSKLVLNMTAILLVAGMVFILIFEYDNPETIGTLTPGGKVLASAFQSVTTRTAGFLTIDQAGLRDQSVLVSLLLMFIGGSPMGTAGGIKTTTIAVLILTVNAYLRGKQDVEVYHRKLRELQVRAAIAVSMISFAVLIIVVIVLSVMMPHADFVDITYELTSALGTVGLSRGMTPALSTAGKWLVIFSMYFGRIGPITLVTAMFLKSNKRPGNVRLAEGRVLIG